MSNPIPTKTENPNGFHRRYNVTRTDGTIPKPGTEYFVLRLDQGASDKDHVNACRLGVLAFADAIATKKPQMARDLYERYNKNVVDGMLLRPELHI